MVGNLIDTLYSASHTIHFVIQYFVSQQPILLLKNAIIIIIILI